MRQPLAALTLALVLAGCGQAPTVPVAELRSERPWEAAAFKAKPAAEQVMLLEAALESTHTQFKATADHQATVAYAAKQLGKPYDNVFRTNDQAAFYCTELAFHALKHGSRAPEVGTRKKLKGLFTVVTTDDFRLSDDLTVVFEKNAPPITPR